MGGWDSAGLPAVTGFPGAIASQPPALGLSPLGLLNRIPQTGYLINNRHLLLALLEPPSPRSRCRRVLVRALGDQTEKPLKPGLVSKPVVDIV